MAKMKLFMIWTLLLLLCFLLNPVSSSSTMYAVNVVYKNSSTHQEILDSINPNSNRMISSMHILDEDIPYYLSVFSADLSEDEAEQLRAHPDVFSVFVPEDVEVLTTYTYEYLGFSAATGIWNRADPSDYVIGVVDTGYTPEHASFADLNLGTPANDYTGFCQRGERFTQDMCNGKVLGAQYFLEHANRSLPGYNSARDADGHGTHVASIAAGNQLNLSEWDVSGGSGGQVASGGAFSARLGIYKACWVNKCKPMDIVSAVRQATKDGVHVISMSLSNPIDDLYNDVIGRATLYAACNEIPVVAAVGNGGLGGHINHALPWVITVGATTTDRVFMTTLVDLDGRDGSSQAFEAACVSEPSSPWESDWHLLHTANISERYGAFASDCLKLDPSTVEEGSVVICHALSSIQEMLRVSRAGLGAAVVFLTSFNSVFGRSEVPFICSNGPCFFLNVTEGIRLGRRIAHRGGLYIRLDQPRVRFHAEPSPIVAHFSSRGPNSNKIIKPDVVAPGVLTFAAHSNFERINRPDANRTMTSMSGTSMSTPQVAALAALLKSLHDDWSASVIKSAIMTTATYLDNTNSPIRNPDFSVATPFDIGSGLINANSALDPGLVLETSHQEYVDYICWLNMTRPSKKTTPDLSAILMHCSEPIPPPYSMNYPSIWASIDIKQTSSVVVKRTLRILDTPNNGDADYAVGYNVKTTVSRGKCEVEVFPDVILFEWFIVNATYDFDGKQTISANFSLTQEGSCFGDITLTDTLHTVRIPFVIEAHT